MEQAILLWASYRLIYRDRLTMQTLRLDLWVPHLLRPYLGHGMGPQCMFCYILTHTHIYIHTYIDLQGWGVKFAMVRYFYTLFLKEGSFKLQVNKFRFLLLITYLLEKA